MTEQVIEQVLVLDPELLEAVNRLVECSGNILDVTTCVLTALLFCIGVASAVYVCTLLYKAVKMLI